MRTQFKELIRRVQKKVRFLSWVSNYNSTIIRQLDSEKFREWFENYCYPRKGDIACLERICQRIRSEPLEKRFFNKEQLRDIISWKVSFDRRIEEKLLQRYDSRETDETIKNKTRILFDENKSVKDKVHKAGGHGGGRLCRKCKKTKITSVGIPVASTILRFIDPFIYAIIDQKAMDALHTLGFKDIAERKQWGDLRPQYRFEPEDYVNYLDLVTAISMKVNLTPCQVDMALWQSLSKCEN